MRKVKYLTLVLLVTMGLAVLTGCSASVDDEGASIGPATTAPTTVAPTTTADNIIE